MRKLSDFLIINWKKVCQKYLRENTILIMFEVVLCKEQLPLPYHHMNFDENGRMNVNPQILCDIITHRYNDRIQPNIGLLIELYDIVKAYECKSIPDIPVAYVTVIFRYVVFNPPIGSVWEGLISKSTEEGISISLSFFKDIFVPYQNLPEGSEFDNSQEIWTWSSLDEESGESIPFTFDQGDTVRFRVCDVKYTQGNN